MAPNRESSAEIETRVKKLLSKMTLPEKIAQIGGAWTSDLIENGQFSSQKAEGLIKNGIGQLSIIGGIHSLPPQKMAAFVNDCQRFLLEKTRLGIPAILHGECLNGFQAKGATIFPQGIGLGSTWDPELIGRMMEVTRQQMRAAGVRQGLAPVLDVARDPRWGRVEETFGEDPYLIARMGVAYIKGLQTEDARQGIAATLKHFAGYGLSESGLNCAPAHVTPRMFRDIYLYPFEKAVREGGVLSVMNAYHEIDGVPCGASRELLTCILREEMGFESLVVSDYFTVALFQVVHKIAKDEADAARLALTAGIDVELPAQVCYGQPLQEQVEKGLIAESLVDRAVGRGLALKIRLGLFENPYVEAEKAAKIFDMPEHRRLALEAARKSIVLLRNKGNLLPLGKKIATIAVIGPNADSKRNLLGDYSYLANNEFVHELEGKPLDTEAGVPIVTVLEGIRAKVGAGTKLLYAQGCEIHRASPEALDEAARVARAADVVILVVGGKSGGARSCTCGEGRDAAELYLTPSQEKLVEVVGAAGTPVVLVLVSGRPHSLKPMADKIPAIIEAWLPGEEGGNAVADVIFGDCNPGGKLPISFPEKAAQIPVYYAQKPSKGKSPFGDYDYLDSSSKPLFEFGFGLSYTTFELTDLRIDPEKIAPDGALVIKVDVRNSGSVAGDEVVQLYINDVLATITRPVKELKGFQRVHLQAGEKRTVEFSLPAELLSFYNLEMKRVVEPGVFKVMVGRSSADIVLEGEFEVEG
jgi:beta-glucosidase